MPVNTALADEVWRRYAWLRDNGHLEYVKKAATCENFFAGIQWDPQDLALLRSQREIARIERRDAVGDRIFMEGNAAAALGAPTVGLFGPIFPETAYLILLKLRSHLLLQQSLCLLIRLYISHCHLY